MSKIKKQIESVTLSAGHALIMSNKPSVISLEMINNKLEKDPQDVEQFGLFDNSTPNYSTYYPDVTAEDLSPKDSEFIEPVYRMLSNVTVHANWNPIYFSSEVLKRSMNKLVGQTINIDHETAVGNAIGAIKSVFWQDSYKSNGKTIPAGINAALKIDGKSNPRIARGIMMDPPSIHSNSVTVNFSWEKSHPELTDEEFRDKFGTFDNKGKLIQKMVTEVLGYHETSLVSHGADPFAQKVGKDGKIVNPSYASDRYMLSADNKDLSNFDWDWKTETDFNVETILNHYIGNNTTNNNNIQKSEKMKDLLKFLETYFGLEVESLTEDNYQEKLGEIDFAAISALAKKADEPVKVLDLIGLEAIENELTTLRTLKENTPEDLEDLTSFAELGKSTIKELRAETKRLYSLIVDEGKEDANILSLIENSDYKILTSLSKQYEKATEGKFQFTCTDCGSHDVTRASANSNHDDDKKKSKSEIRAKLTGENEAHLPAFMRTVEN